MHWTHFAALQIVPLQVTTGVWVIKLKVGLEGGAV